MSDELSPNELRPIGGSWSGLLFENSRMGVPQSLTWTFTFDFALVRRDYGDVEPSLTIDWVPLPGASIASMSGHAASSPFGEPIESSLYFFQHHRFAEASVAIVDQNERRLHVRAAANGDIDALGLDGASVEAWLDFAGIYVQPEDKLATIEAAAELLAQFTDPTGLVGIERSHNYVFRLAASDPEAP